MSLGWLITSTPEVLADNMSIVVRKLVAHGLVVSAACSRVLSKHTDTEPQHAYDGSITVAYQKQKRQCPRPVYIYIYIYKSILTLHQCFIISLRPLFCLCRSIN